MSTIGKTANLIHLLCQPSNREICLFHNLESIHLLNQPFSLLYSRLTNLYIVQSTTQPSPTFQPVAIPTKQPLSQPTLQPSITFVTTYKTAIYATNRSTANFFNQIATQVSNRPYNPP